ncbi:hypothetical protein KIPB_013705, partial [Kipferlia bialata]
FSALLGAGLCVGVMIFMSPVTGIITLLILMVLYLSLSQSTSSALDPEAVAKLSTTVAQQLTPCVTREGETTDYEEESVDITSLEVAGHWGDFNRAQAMSSALSSVWSLESLRLQNHVKSYRPHVLALTGRPMHRPHSPPLSPSLSL